MTIYYESELRHHGIKGMKWGVRRYQNKDGSLTPAGKKHVGRKERLSDMANAYGINVKKYNSSGHSEKGMLRHPDGTPVTNRNTPRRVRKDLDKIYKQKEKETKKEVNEQWKTNRQDYIKKQSIGKRTAKLLLGGPTGAHAYNTMRTSGYGRVASVGATYASNLLVGPVGNVALDVFVSNAYKKSRIN